MRYENEPLLYKKGKVYWEGDVFSFDDWKKNKNLKGHQILWQHHKYILCKDIARSIKFSVVKNEISK